MIRTNPAIGSKGEVDVASRAGTGNFENELQCETVVESVSVELRCSMGIDGLYVVSWGAEVMC